MKSPNGPTYSPLLQLIQWVTNPLDYMDNCVKKYGDVFTTKFSSFSTVVFFSDPAAIQQIFTASLTAFDAGKGSAIFRPFLRDNSLLLLDGQRHRRHRQLLMPPFHGERMRSYGQLICDLTDKVTKSWVVGEFFVARNVMQNITMQVILQAVFGLHEGERYNQLKKLLTSLLEMTGTLVGTTFLFMPVLQKDLGAWSPWGRIVRQIKEIDVLLFAEIAERRANLDPTQTDILSLLITAKDENGEGMSDDELRDELMTLLVAGHETTATALAWALYWIHSLPEVHEKLINEIDSLGENADFGVIARLPYLTAVCQETLRIYPVGLISLIRISQKPVEIAGYEFPSNTWVTACIYLTHRRPDLYPEPHLFKPERFLERQFSPYEYLPFGGGNRMCIGYALAMYEMKLVLATILSRLQLEVAEKTPVKPVRRGSTLAPATGIKMRVAGFLK